MKIKVDTLASQKVIHITGEEDWLAALNDGFMLPGSRTPPQLSADLRISPLAEGHFEVAGRVTYSYEIPCDICRQFFGQSTSGDIKVFFQPEEADVILGHGDLDKRHLDAYYVRDGALDIENLLTDAIHYQSPTTNRCSTCLDRDPSKALYEEKDLSSSPFAALKTLKWDQ